MLRSGLLAFTCLLAVGCTRAAATVDAGPPGVRLYPAPPSAHDGAAALIAQAQKRSVIQKRRLLVYVGAPWCEPCERFRGAAARGELDAEFADVDLLVFDADADAERLATAGYSSNLIPLIAVPGPDGKPTGRQMEGSIKGPGAVAEMTPRLKALLGR